MTYFRELRHINRSRSTLQQRTHLAYAQKNPVDQVHADSSIDAKTPEKRSGGDIRFLCSGMTVVHSLDLASIGKDISFLHPPEANGFSTQCLPFPALTKRYTCQHHLHHRHHHHAMAMRKVASAASCTGIGTDMQAAIR
jgi:hypothetical protein